MRESDAIRRSDERGGGGREITRMPWHASISAARSTARTPALPGAGGRRLPHPGLRSSDERCEDETRHDEFISTTIVYFAWEKCAEEIRAYLEIQEAIQNVPCECQSGRVTLHGRCANCKGSGLQFKPRI